MKNLIFRNNLKRLSFATASDNLFKLFRKIRFAIDLSEFIGYNIDIQRQTALMVVNLIMIDNFASLCICRTVGRTSV